MTFHPMAAVFAALFAVVVAPDARAQAAATAAPEPAAPAVLKPAANLHADGIPDIPAAIVDAVGRYTEFRTAGFAGWHPSKREALILTRFADTNQVHEVRFPGGDRRQLTFYPDRITGASWPRRSGEYFLFTRDRGGDEFSQIFRTDVATGIDDARQRRRPLAERARPLVARGRPDGIRLDAPQRRRSRHLRRRPEGPGDDPAAAHARGRRVAPAGLVARRLEACGPRIHLDQRELPVGCGRRDRNEDAASRRSRAASPCPTVAHSGAPTARDSG